MALDPTTSIGKLRLRIGDWSDLPMLPDSVLTVALEDCNQSIPRASALCAQYILAMLSAKTHKKLAQLETWGSERFENYVTYLKMTVLNPYLSDIAPLPYVGPQFTTVHPIIQFVEEQQGINSTTVRNFTDPETALAYQIANNALTVANNAQGEVDSLEVVVDGLSGDGDSVIIGN